MPSYDALNNFINGIDPEALAKELNQWLAVHQDKLPKSLALDNKDLGHALGAIVTLCRHEDGRPVAMASYSGKKTIANCPLPKNSSSKVMASSKTPPSPPTPSTPKKNELPNQ